MKLESSVTVCYALYDDLTSGEDCEIQYNIDSPYNTYKNEGLPVGPILKPRRRCYCGCFYILKRVIICILLQISMVMEKFYLCENI